MHERSTGKEYVGAGPLCESLSPPSLFFSPNEDQLFFEGEVGNCNEPVRVLQNGSFFCFSSRYWTNKRFDSVRIFSILPYDDHLMLMNDDGIEAGELLEESVL